MPQVEKYSSMQDFLDAHTRKVEAKLQKLIDAKILRRPDQIRIPGPVMTHSIVEAVRDFSRPIIDGGFGQFNDDITVVTIIGHGPSYTKHKDLTFEDALRLEESAGDVHEYCSVWPSIAELTNGLLESVEALRQGLRDVGYDDLMLDGYILITPIFRDTTTGHYRMVKTDANGRVVALPELTHDELQNFVRRPDLIINCVDIRATVELPEPPLRHEEVAIAIGPAKNRFGINALERIGTLTYRLTSHSESRDLALIPHLIDDVITPRIKDYLVNPNSEEIIVKIYITGNKVQQKLYISLLRPVLAEVSHKIELVSVQLSGPKNQFDAREIGIEKTISV